MILKSYFIRYIIMLLCCVGSIDTWAYKVKGSVLNESEEPLSAISIFINNTSIGTQTNDNGEFELNTNLPTPFEVVFSNVGYNKKVIVIKDTIDVQVKVILTLKVDSLTGAEVLPYKRSAWDDYGRDFFNNFIGTSSFANACKILNPQDIYFKYFPEENELRAYSLVPLKIDNQALGYEIHYYLDEFILDYNSHYVYFKGNAQWIPKRGRSQKERDKWTKNRDWANYISLSRFIKSLYNQQLNDSGYLVQLVDRIKAKDFGKKVPLINNSFLIENGDVSILYKIIDSLELCVNTKDDVHQFISSWITNINDNTDQNRVQWEWNKCNQEDLRWKLTLEKVKEETGIKLKYRLYDYELLPPDVNNELQAFFKKIHIISNEENDILYNQLQKRLLERTYDISYTDSINLLPFIAIKDGVKILSLNNYYKITLINTDKTASLKYNLAEFGSIISIKEKEHIQIFSDGNYQHPYDLILEGSWGRFKLDYWLPLDFEQ